MEPLLVSFWADDDKG